MGRVAPLKYLFYAATLIEKDQYNYSNSSVSKLSLV